MEIHKNKEFHELHIKVCFNLSTYCWTLIYLFGNCKELISKMICKSLILKILIWFSPICVFFPDVILKYIFEISVYLLSHVQLFATPWIIACQALLSGFSKQEYWSGLPFPPPGDHPDPIGVYIEVYIHTSPMDSSITAFLPGASYILYCLEKNIITKVF